MDDQPRFLRRIIGWLLVAAAAGLMGAALAGAASMFGTADSPHDRRGEWAPVVVPLMAILSFVPGLLGIRILASSAYRPLKIAVAGALLVGVVICWLRWRFGHAAS